MNNQKHKMLAATLDHYGLDGIKVQNVKMPKCGVREILVKVYASSMNPYDWHQMTGTPYLMRLDKSSSKENPKILGTDFSGVIEEVGHEVTDFKIGDEVFGFAKGSFAEYVIVNEDKLAKKPKKVSFEEAASSPISALTALQGLRDHGEIKKNLQVLINGASGGVGTFAIQIAKHFDATVTAVCSSKNMGLVKDLGAEASIDYTNSDFTNKKNEYDIVFDAVGNKGPFKIMNALKKRGTYITITGPKNKLLGPINHWIKGLLAFKFGQKKAKVFITEQKKKDLISVGQLLEDGVIKPVIETSYPLKEIKNAFKHIEKGHTRGKVIINIYKKR